MSASTPEPTSPPARTEDHPVWDLLRAFRWPFALVALALITFLFYRETLDRTGEAAKAVGGAATQAVREITEGFFSGNMTETFLSSIPSSQDAGGGRLELATAEVTEMFERSEERRVLWDMVSLGRAITEIRVPVTYRYHVLLDDPWLVTIDGPICFVQAPALRPTLPPAIHTDRLERRADVGWLIFDSAEQLDALQRTITPRLEARAQSTLHLRLVRESARRSVREFVRNWLLREDQWGNEGVRAIEVVFADELDGAELDDAGTGSPPLRLPVE